MINLIASTLTILGIENLEAYTIITEPFIGIVYEKSKNEKRVMDIKEITKFCDVTLKKVLTKVLEINQESYLGYKDPPLSPLMQALLLLLISCSSGFVNLCCCFELFGGIGVEGNDTQKTMFFSMVCHLQHNDETVRMGQKDAVTPQLHESAGGLPRLKLPLHSCSLTTNTVKFTLLLVIVKGEDLKDDILNSIMQSLGYEMDDEVLFYYKIALKSLDIGLNPLVSESDYRSFLGYVQKHKVMHVYVELVKKDEEHDSDSDSDSDNKEDESSGNDVIVPNVNVTEDNLEVLDFDSLESDLEDVPKNARSLRLRKLKKKHSSSKFFIGREFANRDLAKDLIRDQAVESRRNLHFLRNDKRRIRVVCNGVVPSKNVIIDKVQGPVVDIFGKGKLVNEDAEEDKSGCPWLLYLSKGDKGKCIIKTFKDEHTCLQSKKIKYCTLSCLSKHIKNLIILNPQMPIKAIQEQMQKKFHVAVSKDKAFWAKAKAQVHLRGDVKVQYALLRDYVCELKRCNLDTTVKIDVYGEEDPKTPTRMFRIIYGSILDGIYPVAYGIVESENQYSCTWFLKCLRDDFDLYSNSNFTFITDRQKGLLPVLAKLFPSAVHMYYVRHIIENMNQTWKGLEYKEMSWRTATAFNQTRVPAKGRAHCHLLINNVCEVFNRQLLDARDSPIINALEFVREYLMKKIVIVQKVIHKCDVPLTPTVAKLFDKIKAASTRCTMEWNGFELYQVKGIPEDWVHDSYKLQTWKNVYSHKVNPVNGRDMWSKYDCPTTLLPPKVHPQIGRPPKKRKKRKGEIVMVKGNKLTRQVPKKTTGTKRTSSVTGKSIDAAEVGTQASQDGTQASTGSTFKRTKKNTSRITPEKVNFITVVGIKIYLNAVGVTAAQVDVNTAQLN
nr:hypothetical protein [Tanacetum cinerariifolium]